MKAVATLVVFLWKLTEVSAFRCKFPNEGCQWDDQCCSGKCIDAHPGTNPRCTKLSLHRPCLYNYQCEGRLRCGRNNTCCARYWGICSRARDCCDPAHMCLEAEGFYYKRCLYSSNTSRAAIVPEVGWSMTWVLLLAALAASRQMTAVASTAGQVAVGASRQKTKLEFSPGLWHIRDVR